MMVDMERILTYTIGDSADGWTILQFLKENHYSHSVIVQLKKTKNGILINDTWTYVSHVLKKGELLTVRLKELPAQEQADTGTHPLLPERLPIDVRYEDEDLLVVNKPSGMPTHPSLGHDHHTLANAIAYHALQRQEAYPFRCINRLDRDTSGLAIIAKNAYSSCYLYEQMRERRIQRTYYAIAEGITPKKGTIDAPIARQKDTILARTVDPSGDRAVTHFQTLAYQNGLSFVRLWLETGRTHQIRVHMRHIGHPLIGDFLYHPTDSRMGRQALHAGKLSLTHPVTGQKLCFSAPLPEDMQAFFPAVIP